MSRPLVVRDSIIATLVAGVAFLVYLATLAPGVLTLNDDTLEFQLVAVRGAIPHPSGYPLYAILLTLWVRLLPFGELAWRANLLSAILAAAAVGVTYLVARRLEMGRWVAVAVAWLFGSALTFWSHATIAEVYALHYLLIALLAWRVLVWADSDTPPAFPLDVGLLIGLGMAHHRMTLLWGAALALLWLSMYTRRAFTLPPLRQWLAAIAVLLLPLLLYAWLPLRAAIGSIDGTYNEVGFGCWVTACQYGSFFSDNPLAQERTFLFFVTQTFNEIGFGAILALIGLWGVSRLPWRKSLFLGAALLPHAIFAYFYRVPDPEVFWLPTVWLLTLLAGVGVTQIAALVAAHSPTESAWRWYSPLGTALLLFVIIGVGMGVRWQEMDRSDHTGNPTLNGVAFNGHDVLRQPIPDNGVVVGLLGEITYLRYLQEAEGVTPTIATDGGDSPDLRLDSVYAALAAGKTPYLTRELAEMGQGDYSFSALGSLIEVRETPRLEVPLGLSPTDQPIGDSLALVGWTRSPIAGSDLQRLTVAWRVVQPLTVDVQVSARVVGAGDMLACETCQLDRPPVHNAYPTSQWREGEVIIDTYDLPAPPLNSRYLLILYLPPTGEEIGRAEIAP